VTLARREGLFRKKNVKSRKGRILAKRKKPRTREENQKNHGNKSRGGKKEEGKRGTNYVLCNVNQNLLPKPGGVF